MAAAFARDWPHPLEGLVVTRYGHAVPCARIEVVEAAHPVPDASGQEAAARILALAEGLAPPTLVCLISGGGSALLALPAEGVSLADKQAVNRRLLRSGATIAEMNAVRKHLSAVKGGRLAAAAHPARVVTYLVAMCPATTRRSSPPAPRSPTRRPSPARLPCSPVRHRRARGRPRPPARRCRDLRPQARAGRTPKPDDPAFAADELVMLATARDALEAAAATACAAGLAAVVLGDDLPRGRGARPRRPARDAGAGHARRR